MRIEAFGPIVLVMFLPTYWVSQSVAFLQEKMRLNTDILVLSIPIIVLWKTRVPLRKKVILLSIFSATVFIMIVAIIRVAVDTTYDQEINIAWLCFWSFVEVGAGAINVPQWILILTDPDYLAIIVSCVASLRQLIITSQTESSSGRGAYQGTSAPILKSSKPLLSPIFSDPVAYVESSIVEYRGKKDFPKSTVHVQSDVEVSTVAVSQIEENKKWYATEQRITVEISHQVPQ